jgi:hypothetical protein
MILFLSRSPLDKNVVRIAHYMNAERARAETGRA